MARPQIHTPERILDVTRDLVLDAGAGAATVGAIAAASGAPTGSIYHQFGSRDALVARLWMRGVKSSQGRFLAAVRAHDDATEATVAGALSVYDFAREQVADARLLVSLRREDLIHAPLSPGLQRELEQLNRPIEKVVTDLARRLFGRATGATLSVTALAALDLPLGAVRRLLVGGSKPPASLRTPLERAVRAVLDEME